MRDRRWLEKGVLPAAGGLNAQSAWWVAAIDAILDVEAEMELRRLRALERQRQTPSVRANLPRGGRGVHAQPTGRTRTDLERAGIL